MLLTQTEMIYARGVKDLLCNPRYLAWMNTHDACGDPFVSGDQGKGLRKQAPQATMELYNTTIQDAQKMQGAMTTEMDYGIREVVDALKEKSMFDLLIFVSDNGG